MSRREAAINLFKEGYNCLQAVLLAFSDLTELSDEQAALVASSFGAGMGKLREVCGAVSGMLMAAGMIRGYTEPRNPTAKAEHYQFVQSLANAFKVRNGSIICRELLKGTVPAEVLRPDTPPEVRTEEYYKKRPCPELIGDAAELLEQMLQQERISKKD